MKTVNCRFCSKKLRIDNISGCCHPKARTKCVKNTCSSCGKVLNRHNKIGVCREHRNKSASRQVYMIEYYEQNIKYLTAYKKDYREENKDKLNQQFYDRMATDIEFKLRHAIRNRINSAVKRNCRAGSAVDALGCSIVEFKRYLESMFWEGMTWNNWGQGPGTWQIDHIIPLSLFELADKEQFASACNYKNMQPLWSHINNSKGGANRIKFTHECPAA